MYSEVIFFWWTIKDNHKNNIQITKYKNVVALTFSLVTRNKVHTADNIKKLGWTSEKETNPTSGNKTVKANNMPMTAENPLVF